MLPLAGEYILLSGQRPVKGAELLCQPPRTPIVICNSAQRVLEVFLAVAGLFLGNSKNPPAIGFHHHAADTLPQKPQVKRSLAACGNFSDGDIARERFKDAETFPGDGDLMFLSGDRKSVV